MGTNINDFTTGSISGALLRFALPFFLTSLIQSLYNIADIMVISRFCGAAGVAGASIGGNIMNTATYTIIGLCNGGAIMTAQYAGMKSGRDIRETISTTFALMVVLSAVFTAAALLFSDKILVLLNTPPEAYGQTKSYFSVCMLGAVFIFGYNTVCAVLRGLGDSKTPMYFGVGACVLNIFLDLLLVGVFGLNASGAALATIISQACAFLGCVIYLKKNSFAFGFKLSEIVLKKAVRILKLGLPGAVQSAIVSGGFLTVSSITNSLGVNAASGVAVAAKINNFAQMPANAVGTAVSSIVGQNVGAEKFDRARRTLKTGIGVSLCIGACMFAIVEVFPTRLMGLLVTDADVINEALPYLRVTALDYLLVAFIFPLNGLCNGSGHTLFTMIPSIFSSVIARVPVAVFCAERLGLGLLGVGISTPTGTISAIIICTVYYLSGKWCRRVV